MNGGYITLLGTEQVQSAAGAMSGAAADMQRAAGSIDSSLERHAARLEEVQFRAEQLAGERPTLRDYFATHLPVDSDDSLSESLAKALLGSERPVASKFEDKDQYWLENARWWAEAYARNRYLKADAMLKARQS